MRRRDFLKRSAATACVLTNGPLLLGMTDKAEAKAPRVGEGEHVYECIHDWGTLPDSIKWQTTHGTAVDSSGLVYITHQGGGKDVMDTVVVFDAKGKFVRSFGKKWHTGGHGIDIRKEGKDEFIYLCHMTGGGPVVKTTLKGEVVWSKGAPEESMLYEKKQPYRPTNIAFAADGGYYIADGYGSHYIHQYDKDDKWVRSWGGQGAAAGKMSTPHGIWVDDRPGRKPSIVVADRANKRLQYFSLDGKHLSFVEGLLFPAHCETRGEVLLVPDLHARITLFDKDNKPIVQLGDDEPWRKKVLDGFKVRTKPDEWKAGKFVHPHDACFDKAGNIIVAEWVGTGRITFLRHVG